MMKTAGQLREVRHDRHVQAFLALIRYTEGADYRTLFGGEQFESFADHPRQAITKPLGGKPITSTAAGAYQFLARTWDDIVANLGLEDFSPASQDVGALFLVDRRKALDDVLIGNWQSAIAKCNREWASLPGSPYGQPTKSLAKCLAFLSEFLGTAIPAQPQQPDVQPKKEKTVTPFAWAAFEFLASKIPVLIKSFGNGERSEKNAEAAQKVLDIAMPLVGATNEQDLISKVQDDPAAVTVVSKAIEERWFDIVGEVGGGIPAAREADARMNPAGVPWLSPAVWVSAAIMPLIYMVVGAVMFGSDYTDDQRTLVITAVINLALGGIIGFFLGTGYNSQRRADLREGGKQ